MICQIPLGISNVFLLKGKRPILVDTGRPQEAARIVAALEKENVALAELALILLTHHHWDHGGAARELRNGTKAPLAIHRLDAPLLETGQNGDLQPTCWFARLFKPFVNRSFPGTVADLLLEDEFDLEPYGLAGRTISTPGHTPGSLSVVTQDGEAIVGDLLMGGYLGGKLFPTRPGYHYFAEDKDLVRASLRKVLSFDPRIIYVSHGGPLQTDAVKRWLDRQ